MSRTPIIAANWKMYKTTGEARTFVAELLPQLVEITGADVVICPPFTSLEAVGNALRGSRVALAAQNVHPEPQGAFTGEISVQMLTDLGCRYVVLGHSERRQYFGETDALVGAKVRAVLAAGLEPILCVGESLAQREAGSMTKVIAGQLEGAIGGLSADEAARLVIAYEPIWAIGTGKSASAEDAQAVCAEIRRWVAEQIAPATAAAIRIQYGGSVKPGNIAAYMGQPDIDGALVGGASLEATSFAALAAAAQPKA